MKLTTLNKLVPDKGATAAPSLRDYDGKEVDILSAAIEKTGGKTRKGEEIEKPYVYIKNGSDQPTKLLASISIVELMQRRFTALDEYVKENAKDAAAIKAAELPFPLPEDKNAWRYMTVKVTKQQRGVKVD